MSDATFIEEYAQEQIANMVGAFTFMGGDLETVDINELATGISAQLRNRFRIDMAPQAVLVVLAEILA